MKISTSYLNMRNWQMTRNNLELPWLNFDTLLSWSKLNRRLNTVHFWHFFDASVFDIFSCPCHFIHIAYNLDMIFYHQSLFDTLLSVSKCIWHTSSVSKRYQKCIKTRGPILIGSKVQPGKVHFIFSIYLKLSSFCGKALKCFHFVFW